MSDFFGNSDLGLDLDYPITQRSDVGLMGNPVTAVVGYVPAHNLGFHLYGYTDQYGGSKMVAVYFDGSYLVHNFSDGSDLFNEVFPDHIVVDPLLCIDQALRHAESIGCNVEFSPHRIPKKVFSNLREGYSSYISPDLYF